MIQFYLQGEYIELYKILKLEGAASTGGEAKAMIAEGLIRVNGEVELRKRNKLHVGDTVTLEGYEISIVETKDPA